MGRSIVIAPDSFKGTISASQAAAALAEGWRRVAPADRIRVLPQADGGEGTLEVVAGAVPGAQLRSAGVVHRPDGRDVPGEWLELPGGQAVVELAHCSGLPLMRVPDALGATTRGLGEVIGAALDAGASSLVVALGGSASTDAGFGALAALGLRARDAGGSAVPDGGGALLRIAEVDRSRLRPPPPGGVVLLTDVTAPLAGPTGAAAVFGPQKGATEAAVQTLDAGLRHVAALLGGDPVAAGSGAAGGTAFGLATCWGATIVPGAAWVAHLTGLDDALAGADVVLTGEGRFDAQSLGGKVVGHVLGRAASLGVPAGVVAGRFEVPVGGWTASLADLAGSVEAAVADPARWLRAAGSAAAVAFPS